MPSKAEIAWMAGIIEGEGSIGLKSNNKGGIANVPWIKVAMTDEDVIAKLHSVAGFGTVCSSPCASGKTLWLWQSALRDKVPKFLKMIRPWMGERRLAKIDEVLAGAAVYGWDGTQRSIKWSEQSGRVVVHA